MRICTVVGARPQFIKAAVVSAALREAGCAETLVHTGQHYDAGMSAVFFEELSIPAPAVNLGVGSGTHAQQTGATMTRLEAFVDEEGPFDWMLVYGDTNSTLAATLVAAKLPVPLAHVEAGLRSFNRAMPEEVNRIVTDRLATHCYCPSPAAIDNLAEEGITDGVFFTGDVMYDALLRYQPVARKRYPVDNIVPYGAGEYVLMTLHRAENVDHPDRLQHMMDNLEVVPWPIVWPQHPRAKARLDAFDVAVPERVHVIEPVSYLEMLSLLDGARLVLTDSGGVQKEAYWSRCPCITLRSETEWVETVKAGWNTVVGADREKLVQALEHVPETPPQPHYGDGDAAATIAALLRRGPTSSSST
ncbi:MAG: UDP-N-acetylglucosamine 2-epimerase (non-hydrolyzing) [Bacteroidetes bacterium]|jgi:UDP-GlcNAc3NAcA epimerase|nr:UDP-N-acetylglucosamine 2-epimerase (non-hydrolyzing) [Bacteroidota bacterium]